MRYLRVVEIDISAVFMFFHTCVSNKHLFGFLAERVVIKKGTFTAFWDETFTLHY